MTSRSPKTEPHPATIRDVAREAGVSIATISRVFNGSARVSRETAQRVSEVATRLGYWPNGAARSLITRRTHALGVLLPDLYGEFFSEVIRGLDLTARRQGYHLMVSSSHSDLEELLEVLRSMRGRIDGLIAMTPDSGTPAVIDREFASRFPVVLLNPGREVRRCSTIGVANVEGAERMVRHLADLGHERIAMIRGPERNVDAEQRLEGYRSALALLGRAPIEAQGEFSEASGHAATRELLALRPRPTALFAANDAMAVGALAALRQAGLRVPEDVALVGFDDITTAAFLHPPLTTVRVDPFGLGERAVAVLIQALQDGHLSVSHQILRTTLVVRETCGAHARSGGSAVDAAPPADEDIRGGHP